MKSKSVLLGFPGDGITNMAVDEGRKKRVRVTIVPPTGSTEVGHTLAIATLINKIMKLDKTIQTLIHSTRGLPECKDLDDYFNIPQEDIQLYAVRQLYGSKRRLSSRSALQRCMP